MVVPLDIGKNGAISMFFRACFRVAEGRNDKAALLATHTAMATTREWNLLFDDLDQRLDCPEFVAGQLLTQRFIAETVQDRERLRRRAGDVDAQHALARACLYQ